MKKNLIPGVRGSRLHSQTCHTSTVSPMCLRTKLPQLLQCVWEPRSPKSIHTQSFGLLPMFVEYPLCPAQCQALQTQQCARHNRSLPSWDLWSSWQGKVNRRQISALMEKIQDLQQQLCREPTHTYSGPGNIDTETGKKAGVNWASQEKDDSWEGTARAKTQRQKRNYSPNQATGASIGLFGHLSVLQAYHFKIKIVPKFYDLMLC